MTTPQPGQQTGGPPGLPPLEISDVRLTDDIKQSINSAYPTKTVLLAYVDQDGQPSLSFRGTAQAYSDTELAIWARNPEGGLLKALSNNNRVTLLWRDPETRANLQFKGMARVDDSEQARRRVYDSAPENERNADKEQKGKPVIIELDRVDGMVPGKRLSMRKGYKG